MCKEISTNVFPSLVVDVPKQIFCAITTNLFIPYSAPNLCSRHPSSKTSLVSPTDCVSEKHPDIFITYRIMQKTRSLVHSHRCSHVHWCRIHTRFPIPPKIAHMPCRMPKSVKIAGKGENSGNIRFLKSFVTCSHIYSSRGSRNTILETGYISYPERPFRKESSSSNWV